MVGAEIPMRIDTAQSIGAADAVHERFGSRRAAARERREDQGREGPN